MTEEEIEAFVKSLDGPMTDDEPGFLTWAGTDKLFEMLDQMLPPGPELDDTVQLFISGMREAGVNTDDETHVLLFTKGMVSTLNVLWYMLNDEGCGEIPHVYGHAQRAALRMGIALRHLRSQFEKGRADAAPQEG